MMQGSTVTYSVHSAMCAVDRPAASIASIASSSACRVPLHEATWLRLGLGLATATGGERARAALRLHERQLERQAARAIWLGVGLARSDRVVVPAADQTVARVHERAAHRDLARVQRRRRLRERHAHVRVRVLSCRVGGLS